MNKNIAIGALWIITVCIFGTLWYLLHLKKQRARHQYLWDDYKNTTDKFTALDILVIIVVPTIIVYVFNLVHFI